MSLSWKSSWNRRGTLLLILFSIAMSALLLLGIEKIKVQIKENFMNAISGTDLIVGARGSESQLVMYAVFHLGHATNNMTWRSVERIANRDEVDWVIPISLGDSHKGYPVVATNQTFFDHYKYQKDRTVNVSKGENFKDLLDVVVGSEAAKNLKYELGQTIVLSHGKSDAAIAQHEDKPFKIVGILEPTGTPVDHSLFISLEAMEAIHINWQGGMPIPGLNISAEQLSTFDLTPKNITALLVGLKKRSHVFAVQRSINDYRAEPLMAVLPGVTMDQIWDMMSSIEKILFVISSLVTIVGLAGLTSTIIAGLGERRRELAILRSVGAKPIDIFILLAYEGLLLVILGVILGIVLLNGLIVMVSPWLMSHYGVFIHLSWPTSGEALLMIAILIAGFLTSIIPAYRAYRISLSDGLSISK